MRTGSLLCLTIFLILSCGSSTETIGSWKSDNIPAERAYQKVFIAALTPNVNVRNSIENSLAAAAREKGVEVVTSHQVFPQQFTSENQPSKEEILNKVKEQNARAIFTVALKDKESETRYVPGSTTYAPMSHGYYGRFNTYYNTVYPVTYDPGYYTEDKIYYLESNLYDTQTEELLWSAQSKTVNPSIVESFAKDYTKTIIKELVRDGVLKE